ncbi:ABC transporter permease, partial [Methylobacterium radiotolerans]
MSLVAVNLREPARAKEVAGVISERLDLEAETQGDMLSFMDRAMKISDAVRFGISLIALIVG